MLTFKTVKKTPKTNKQTKKNNKIWKRKNSACRKFLRNAEPNR